MKLSAQDESVISQVWGKDLSLVEIWKSYQRTHLQETVPWHQAIDEYLEHLASNKHFRGLRQLHALGAQGNGKVHGHSPTGVRAHYPKSAVDFAPF